MEINKVQGSNISYKGGREVVRLLSNPDSLASTIALETSVTGGRGANAYKRGGFPEFRERFTDDVVSAFFWMKGVDIFNKLGDKFGKHILKLPTTEFDVGEDALRSPFKNVVQDFTKDVDTKEAAKSIEKKLAVFKFSKIVLSTLLAIGFVGILLPKINQAITDKLMKKKKTDNSLNNKFDYMQEFSFEEFDKKISSTKSQSFKGISPQIIAAAANALENNKIVKMLSCDVGILTGRVSTARNADEGREYLFRDASSSFFYYASTPLIYKILQKLTDTKNCTDIDPVAAKKLHDLMAEQLRPKEGSYASMNVSRFIEKVTGILDEKAKEKIKQLPFKSGVISISEFKKFVTDENIINKAVEMAKLQPEQAGIGAVLTKQQVQDIFKNGVMNTPEFMSEIYKDKFGDALTNPYKYIPMKKITAFRDNMEKYVQDILKAAKENSNVVDINILDNINKKNYALTACFRAFALACSAFALGIAIPKIQYAITAKRTGTNAAPGLRKYQEQTKNSTKA